MKKFFIALCVFAAPLFSAAQSELPEILQDVEVLDLGFTYAVLSDDEYFYEQLYEIPVESTIYKDDGTQTDVREFDGLLVITNYHPLSSDVRITMVTELY